MEQITLELPFEQMLVRNYERIRECDGYRYILDDDVLIESWVVKKEIKHYPNFNSHYRWSWYAFLEFIIIDVNGAARKVSWYYYPQHSYDTYVEHKKLDLIYTGNLYGVDFKDEETGRFINHFITKFVIKHLMQCEDWEDFDAYCNIVKIRNVLDKHLTNISQFEQIKSIVNE